MTENSVICVAEPRGLASSEASLQVVLSLCVYVCVLISHSSEDNSRAGLGLQFPHVTLIAFLKHFFQMQSYSEVLGFQYMSVAEDKIQTICRDSDLISNYYMPITVPPAVLSVWSTVIPCPGNPAPPFQFLLSFCHFLSHNPDLWAGSSSELQSTVAFLYCGS